MIAPRYRVEEIRIAGIERAREAYQTQGKYMRCFNHQDIDAVGICKHCGKGLCPSCLTDLGYGLACRDSHEQIVEEINTLITRNSQVQRGNSKAWFVVPAFFAFTGLIFFGSSGFFSDGESSAFTIVLGLSFLVYSAVLFVINYRTFKATGA